MRQENVGQIFFLQVKNILGTLASTGQRIDAKYATTEKEVNVYNNSVNSF